MPLPRLSNPKVERTVLSVKRVRLGQRRVQRYHNRFAQLREKVKQILAAVAAEESVFVLDIDHVRGVLVFETGSGKI